MCALFYWILFPIAFPLTSFASVITVVWQIRIVTWWWVWRLIFPVFLTLFLLIAFIFIWWWVWQWWVWVRVIWYVPFSILLWWNGEMLFSILLWWNGEMLFSILLWWNSISPFHHRKMENSISPFHHSKMEKSISPFHHRKMEEGTYQMTRIQNRLCHTYYQRKRNAIIRKTLWTQEQWLVRPIIERRFLFFQRQWLQTQTE